MPLICYRELKFSPDRLATIGQANDIITEFNAQGFDLTLRQLFYQFVSRDLIPNTQRAYKTLGSLVNDARLAGLIDWDSIVDRTRNLRSLAHWESPEEIVRACAQQFRHDLWRDQPIYVEVWIEKDALVGVIEKVCHEFDVPHFSCRGYTSQSEMWSAAQRLIEREENGGAETRETVILHLGDHDPSGVDMSRDIQDRLSLFGSNAELVRLALNEDQVVLYNPPPNPTKITDSRASGYIARHGDESWELDALEPRVIVDLIRKAIEARLDQEAWKAALERQGEQRQSLQNVSDRWGLVMRTLTDNQGES